MSHWAELDANNKVIRVLVGSNEGDEGEAFFNSLGGTWIQTSYNARIRKNYAGIGFSYDPDLDAFIPPKANCHDDEIFNETTCQWICDNDYHKSKEFLDNE
jgi:hypothetical protein